MPGHGRPWRGHDIPDAMRCFLRDHKKSNRDSSIGLEKDVYALIFWMPASHFAICSSLVLGLVLSITEDSSAIEGEEIATEQTEVFARDKIRLRVFLNDSEESSLPSYYQEIRDFARNVSTRVSNIEQVCVWTSRKRAAKQRNHTLTHAILEAWSAGKNKSETADAVKRLTRDESAVEEFDKILKLWEDPGRPITRRTHRELEDKRRDYLSDLGTTASKREHESKDDGFRLSFQRDRDRVLWSASLKRLANKTQVFPVSSDDQLRRRLSHSVEVMQLSSTIATSFGLDRDLTEAGALAHDIGHTPFGHAGEHALDKALNDIDENFGGFSHYEHGVDVVVWLEDVYRSPAAGGIPGLNLTNATIEAIFKHVYHRRGHKTSQTELLKKTKHSCLKNDSCHLEGQSIRAADKISYLISDLEDGIRNGILTVEDLRTCRFFDRPPIDLAVSSGELFLDRFVSQRRAILKVLMEDILHATDRRLGRLGSLDAIRSSDDNTVDHSQELQADLKEIWEKLQKKKIHTHSTVRAANMRAARIVSDLLILFALAPEVVSTNFRRNHDRLTDTKYIRHYVEKVGDKVGIGRSMLRPYFYERVIGSNLHAQGDNWMIPTKQLVLAKDYVASLTDTAAEQEYRRHLGAER